MADDNGQGGTGNTGAGDGDQSQDNQGGAGTGGGSVLGGEGDAGTGEGGEGQGGTGDGTGQGEGGEGEGDGGDGAPEAYADFTMPEGFEANAEFTSSFSELARADNLSQEKAQKYVDLAATVVAAAVEQQAAQWREVQAGWAKALNTDPDIGGANREQAQADARLAIQKMGLDAETAQWLNQTGVGNHPGLVKVFANIGKLFREDKIQIGGDAGAGDQTVANILYPNQGKET